MPYLPEPGDAGALLGTLLSAQAAIAALTLAVTLFMMQGISARRDVDDRIYREYVRRSWVRDILWGSLLAVAATGVLLLSEGFISGDGATVDVMPELSNFVLVAGLAFLINLALAGVLFERAILLSRPEQWMALRRDVNKTDVREAIQAFLRRARRAHDASEANKLDSTVWLPDRAEGSADEAVRALLDDARRAMSERRHEELRRSLDSIRELVTYAMDEIKTTDIQWSAWSAPGSQPKWPPLLELSHNLNSFREDMIREGNREYIIALQFFDYMLTADGMSERCGELFTVGLNGYRWNYQIATRVGGGEFREMLRDAFSQDAYSLIPDAEPVEIFPYVREMVRQQERLLSDAMRSDQPSDYDQLHKRFQTWLETILFDWETDNWLQPEASELHQQLEQEYRIALMGLGGRALFLAQSNWIADVNPYLDVGRRAYADLGPMAGDLAAALARDDYSPFSMWGEWEREGAEPDQVISILPERYPLMFCTLRLMELSSETMPTFDLRGRAQRALDWFVDNAESVGAHVRAELDLTLEQRSEFVTDALRSAVRRDEVAEDYEIIGRELSTDRVSDFKLDVYANAVSVEPVELLFHRAGAFQYFSSNSDDSPEERVFRQLMPKAYFTDTPEGAPIYYASHRGAPWGRPVSDDVLRRFCDALEKSPKMMASLETPATLLQAIDRAIEDINPSGLVAVVLAGNWSDLEVGLRIENLEGYEKEWQLPKDNQIGEFARYHGHPIFRVPRQESRRVYVVEPAAWGCFLRAQFEDAQDLRIEIKPISIDRAREHLTNNPNHFASQPDEETKLRKLQTQVEIEIGARTGFRVTDPSRARVVVPADQSEL